MRRPVYRNGAMLPDPDRVADAHHIRRDPVTGEISWPPSRMAAVLRELKLIEDKDHDT